MQLRHRTVSPRQKTISGKEYIEVCIHNPGGQYHEHFALAKKVKVMTPDCQDDLIYIRRVVDKESYPSRYEVVYIHPESNQELDFKTIVSLI